MWKWSFYDRRIVFNYKKSSRVEFQFFLSFLWFVFINCTFRAFASSVFPSGLPSYPSANSVPNMVCKVGSQLLLISTVESLFRENFQWFLWCPAERLRSICSACLKVVSATFLLFCFYFWKTALVKLEKMFFISL